MKKNFYSRNRWLALCLLSCMLLLGGTGLSAQSWTYGNERLTNSEGMTLRVIPNGKELTINGLSNKGSNSSVLDLTGEIEGGYTITEIGGNAFAGDVPFTTIKIAKTIKNIGDKAFYQSADATTSITSVEFEEGSVLKTIGDKVFYKAEQLVMIKLPASLNDIGEEVFKDCSSLAYVICPSLAEPETIKANAFAGVSPDFKVYATKASSGWTPEKWGLTDPNRIIYQTRWIYSPDDQTLTSLNNPDLVLQNVTADNDKKLTIGNNQALSGGIELDLTGDISDGYKITEIGNEAFSGGNKAFTAIKIPKTVTRIGMRAFNVSGSDTSTASVEFEEGSELIEIKSNAFRYFVSLKTINLPAFIESVGSGAFEGCSSLASVVCLGTIEPIIGNTAFDGVAPGFKVYATKVAAGWRPAQWGLTDPDRIIYQTRWIYSSADQTLTCLDNPNLVLQNVTADSDKQLTIGTNPDLFDINTPAMALDLTGTVSDGYTITAIADRAFTVGYGKKSPFTSIKIAKTIKTIGSQAFYNGFQETSATLEFEEGSVLEVIGPNAFYRFVNITTISFPATIKEIGNNAFCGCSSLASVYCPTLNEPKLGSGGINYTTFKDVSPDFKVYATAATGGWHPEWWGLGTDESRIIYKPSSNWTYDSGKLTYRGGKIILNTTAPTADNMLTITGCEKMDTTFLSLDSMIVDANDHDIKYAIASVGAGALTKFTAKDTLRLTADEPFAIDATAFNAAVKDSSIIYVPKGKVDTYANADVWKDFLNFIEEGENAYLMDLVFMKDTATSHLATQLRAPIYRQKGKEYSFFIASTDSANYGVPKTIKAYKNGSTTEAEAGKDYNYDPETGKVSITTVDANWKFEASAIGVLKPDEGEGLIITSDSLYTSGTDEKQFNGTIDGTDKPVSSVQIGINEGNEKVTMFLAIRNLIVEGDPDDPETPPTTTVTSNAKTHLMLEGDNNLGTLMNNGELYISRNGEAQLTGTEIINNSIFVDSTGLITEVKGGAELRLTSLSGSLSIAEGSTSTVTVNAGPITVIPGITPEITYQWYKWVNNEWKETASEWLEDQTQPTPARAALYSGSLLRSDDPASTIVTDQKALTFGETTTGDGMFRCEVKRVVEEYDIATNTTKSVTTILNTYTEVKFESASPDITYYQVTLPAIEGATTDPKAGSYDVEEGYSFSFTITLDKEYDLSTPVVKVGDKVIEADANGKYVIKGINANITISVTGIVKNTTVGNAEVENAEARVWYSNGTLHVYTPQPAHVRIVSFSGSPYKDLGKVNGDASVAIRHGSYIVIIGERTFKIAL